MLGLDVVVVRGQGGPRREHRLPLRHDRQGLYADEPTLREGTGCPKNITPCMDSTQDIFGL